jgi:hypothetical protein
VMGLWFLYYCFPCGGAMCCVHAYAGYAVALLLTDGLTVDGRMEADLFQGRDAGTETARRGWGQQGRPPAGCATSIRKAAWPRRAPVSSPGLVKTNHRAAPRPHAHPCTAVRKTGADPVPGPRPPDVVSACEPCRRPPPSPALLTH